MSPPGEYEDLFTLVRSARTSSALAATAAVEGRHDPKYQPGEI